MVSRDLLTKTPLDRRTHDDKGAIEILQSLTNQHSIVIGERTDNAEFDKHLETLLSLGLVRSSATAEGVAYEITETGSRFLQEYHQIKGDKGLRLEIEPERILGPLAKAMVTVVIPTLNEAEGITGVMDEVRAEGYKNVLVVDGYSTDNTPHIANGNGAKVVYQHGAGKAGAVKTAIERVETPFMVFMDGDHTYDPKDIWRLLNHNEHYCHVIGARDKKHIPWLHRFGNWVISRTFSLLFTVKTSDVCSGMYLLETEEAKKYGLQEPGFIAEIELAAHSAATRNLTEVPISYRPRIGTRKLNTWKDGLAILSAAFGLARRHNPVLLYSGIAGLSIIPAALVLGWVVYEQLMMRRFHSGWALAGIMMLLVAAQAFTLASVSILTKHTEERLTREIRGSK
jgi:dolichol-phosphate mannosyltransferase